MSDGASSSGMLASDRTYSAGTPQEHRMLNLLEQSSGGSTIECDNADNFRLCQFPLKLRFFWRTRMLSAGTVWPRFCPVPKITRSYRESPTDRALSTKSADSGPMLRS